MRTGSSRLNVNATCALTNIADWASHFSAWYHQTLTKELISLYKPSEEDAQQSTTYRGI